MTDQSVAGEEALRGESPAAAGEVGARVVDSEGRSWIDVGGSYGSVNVGYGRLEVAQAAYEQMLRVTPSQFRSPGESALSLIDRLASASPIPQPRIFLVRSAYEASDAALRVVRAFHQMAGDGSRTGIITPGDSYRAADGLSTVRGGEDDSNLEPNVILAPQPNPYRCPMGGRSAFDCAVRCAHAVEDLILSHGAETIAAVVAEPIFTTEGAVVPGEEYWPMLREICNEYGVLLVADEVVTGFGRTGRMFAVEHWGVTPDLITLGIGNQGSHLPLGVVIAKEEVAGGLPEDLLPMRGHPVSTAAAVRTLEIIQAEHLDGNPASIGGYFKEQLEGLKVDHPILGDVRGLGLMLAMELVGDRETGAGFPPESGVDDRLTEAFARRGLILRSESGIVRMGPPLAVTRDDVDEIVHGIDLALWGVEGDLGISTPP